MARVVVTDDAGSEVLMDERVQPMHLDDPHSSWQMIERLAWAVQDAEGTRQDGSVSPVQRHKRLQLV